MRGHEKYNNGGAGYARYSGWPGRNRVYGHAVSARGVERRSDVNISGSIRGTRRSSIGILNPKWLAYRIGVIVVSATGAFTGLSLVISELMKDTN